MVVSTAGSSPVATRALICSAWGARVDDDLASRPSLISRWQSGGRCRAGGSLCASFCDPGPMSGVVHRKLRGLSGRRLQNNKNRSLFRESGKTRLKAPNPAGTALAIIKPKVKANLSARIFHVFYQNDSDLISVIFPQTE
jgi:hypothetical protein